MNEASLRAWAPVVHRPRAVVDAAGRRSLLKRLAMISIGGMFVLLPVQAVDLPLNLAPVDLWNLLGLPIIWMYLLQARRPLRLPYAVAMWLILLGSLIGMFSARDVATASVVVLKEVYLYVWFVTLTLLLTSANARDLRSILLAWVAMMVLHGLIIIAEFLSPTVWHAMISLFGRVGKLDEVRPPGLFDNPNGAAFFQLMGFVPVVLACASNALATIFGIVLVLSIVGTGSLGVTLGLLTGALVAVLAIAVTGGAWQSRFKVLVLLLAVTGLLYGLYAFMAGYAPYYEERFAYYFYSRAERSAETRFGLWHSGVASLSSGASLWGLGPGNVTDSLSGKTLHNDFLVFALERGAIGVLGLLLLCVIATYKAVRILTSRMRLVPAAAAIILLATLVAAFVDAQFHQVFHERGLWMVLAMQEAILLKTIAVRKKLRTGSYASS